MSKIKLYYGGERFNEFTGKMKQAFFRPDGKLEGYWSGIKGVWIGEAYWAKGKYGGDKVTISGRPERAGDATHEKEEEWRAKSWADKAIYKSHQVKKRAEKMRDLLPEIEKIKRFAKGLTFAQKRVFVEWILDEVEREEREKMNRTQRPLRQGK